MHLQILIATILVMAACAMPEPPSPFLDEPLEGTKLDPELLSRVRDLLTSDTTAPASSGGASRQSVPLSSYNPGSPSGSYGTPGSTGGFGGTRGFGASPNSGPLGGSGPGTSPAADITISDPELAPLIDSFDLSPTVQKRTGSKSAGLGGGSHGSGSRFGGSDSGGY